MTSYLLTDMGFDVVTASDHTKVIDVAHREKPDLLLQDVRMPGLDLDRLVKSIRADASLKRLPIILFSASMDLGETAVCVGVEGILDKPFKPSEVTDAVRTALATPVGGTA